MANLKDLRVRIGSVKSTRKITSAMKMVSAAKLRRAQLQAQNARPYAERLHAMVRNLAGGVDRSEVNLPLLNGTGKAETLLLVVISADRGLCGGFNSNVVRRTRVLVRQWQQSGKEVKILCVGKKARDQLVRDMGHLIIDTILDVAKPALSYTAASNLGDKMLALFDEGAFDQAHVLYNRFQSAMTQVVTLEQVIPLPLPANADAPLTSDALYIYEPSEQELLETLLPKNLKVQLYKTLLESVASEHGARMTAMDNATRNAGDMIKRLTLYYNRTRQAQITKELIEIISGAEAI
jgi:F-type H+-transporting ATPase subunit gamma